MWIVDAALTRRNKRLKTRLALDREKVNSARKESRKASIALVEALRELEELKTKMACEHCENCNTDIGILWDAEQDGLMAFCPNCGQPIMLCSICTHECDFDWGSGLCGQMEVLKKNVNH